MRFKTDPQEEKEKKNSLIMAATILVQEGFLNPLLQLALCTDHVKTL